MLLDLNVTRPEHEHPTTLYSNFDHVLNSEVAEELVHDQAKYGFHAAKGYCGYVYAVTREDGGVVWCEDIWVLHTHIHTYVAKDLEELLLHSTGEMGYG